MASYKCATEETMINLSRVFYMYAWTSEQICLSVMDDMNVSAHMK